MYVVFTLMSAFLSYPFSVRRDLSEQIKKVTMEIHTRAEKTELMMSFMRGQVTLAQYKVKPFKTICIR